MTIPIRIGCCFLILYIGLGIRVLQSYGKKEFEKIFENVCKDLCIRKRGEVRGMAGWRKKSEKVFAELKF